MIVQATPVKIVDLTIILCLFGGTTREDLDIVTAMWDACQKIGMTLWKVMFRIQLLEPYRRK